MSFNLRRVYNDREDKLLEISFEYSGEFFHLIVEYVENEKMFVVQVLDRVEESQISDDMMYDYELLEDLLESEQEHEVAGHIDDIINEAMEKVGEHECWNA